MDVFPRPSVYVQSSESGPQAAAVEEPRVMLMPLPDVLAHVPEIWLQSALPSNVWLGLNSMV